MEFTVAQVKERVLGQLEGALRFLLPNGVIKGHEFRVGSVHGEAGSSLAVELRGNDRGAWKDFAHPGDASQCGDILSLWCAVRGQTFKETLPEIAKWVGFNFVERTPPKPKPPVPPKNDIAAIGPELVEYWQDRGITLATLKKYRVRQHTRPSDWNTVFSCFVFIDTDGAPVMIKSTGIQPIEVQRKDGTKGKAKDIWTSQPYYTLWGWWLVDDNCRSIIVTEGEADAMTVAQMDPGMPVLSLPSGASNFDWIENDYARLTALERIYLVTDNDAPHPKTGLKAGDECAKEVSRRLGATRVWRVPVPLPYKDPNEVLLSGDDRLVHWTDRWLPHAKTMDPPSITSPDEYRADAQRRRERARVDAETNRFIWPKIPFAFRRGELTAVSGYPHGGKSAWLYQSHAHEMWMGERVFFASYEIPPGQMEIEFAHFLLASAPEEISLNKCVDWLEGRCWFYQPPPRNKRELIIPDLFDSMDYAVQRYGVSRVVVDSLHFVVKKEEYEAQDEFMERLLDFCRTRDVHLAVVCHSKVKQNLDIIPGMDLVEGSGGIVKPLDNGITIWRNTVKPREIEKAEEDGNISKLEAAQKLNDGMVWIWKQRLSGKTPRVKVWFNSEAKTFRINRDEEPPSILGTPPPTTKQEELF